MINKELAKIFFEIADYLDMDEVSFRPQAYRKAANSLEVMEENVGDIYKKGGIKALENISGVGKNIAKRIEEYLKKGKIQYYERFKKRLPLNLEELNRVEGMGPKRAKLLYSKLGVRDLKTLEKAAKSHKIASLDGFGEKTEKNIIEAINFLKRSKGRFLLGEILPSVKEIQEKLESQKEIEQISPAGSVRRKKETIGDVDILVATKNPKKIADFFVSLPGIVKIWGKGQTKSSIRMKEGFDVDLRVLRKKSYGSALQYFTGSKEHNIALRRIAIQKGLKLSEYGLFKGRDMIAGWSEEGVYKALGLLWIEPELRENQGEIEAAMKGRLPNLVNLTEIKGDLHCHSNWDGGLNSIDTMVKEAKIMGYEYLGISDHTKFLRIEKGLNEKKLEMRNKEIDRLNKKQVNFRILKGAETNILNDGSIDIKDEALKKLDYVIAGLHSNFKMEKDRMTERIIRAMKNPNIDILSHPTGRILKKRDEYQCDFDKVLRAAKAYNVSLEINASPLRLDLNDQNIKRAKEAGVKMIINSDAHRKEQLYLMEFGVYQARRGWAEKEDIINTHSVEELLKYFK
ncbi:MAG: DNA polymerase/3'-5' exonuclease PolX [Candidatus Nealsonbacteria bacterium]